MKMETHCHLHLLMRVHHLLRDQSYLSCACDVISRYNDLQMTLYCCDDYYNLQLQLEMNSYDLESAMIEKQIDCNNYRSPMISLNLCVRYLYLMMNSRAVKMVTICDSEEVTMTGMNWKSSIDMEYQLVNLGDLKSLCNLPARFARSGQSV